MVEVNGQKEIPNEGAKESETVITKLKKQGRQQFFRLFIFPLRASARISLPRQRNYTVPGSKTTVQSHPLPN
jgi:hypothetical protein